MVGCVADLLHYHGGNCGRFDDQLDLGICDV